jgi:hypothetical protein
VLRENESVYVKTHAHKSKYKHKVSQKLLRHTVGWYVDNNAHRNAKEKTVYATAEQNEVPCRHTGRVFFKLFAHPMWSTCRNLRARRKQKKTAGDKAFLFQHQLSYIYTCRYDTDTFCTSNYAYYALNNRLERSKNLLREWHHPERNAPAQRGLVIPLSQIQNSTLLFSSVCVLCAVIPSRYVCVLIYTLQPTHEAQGS